MLQWWMWFNLPILHIDQNQCTSGTVETRRIRYKPVPTRRRGACSVTQFQPSVFSNVYETPEARVLKYFVPLLTSQKDSVGFNSKVRSTIGWHQMISRALKCPDIPQPGPFPAEIPHGILFIFSETHRHQSRIKSRPIGPLHFGLQRCTNKSGTELGPFALRSVF